ncbi:MAG: V-type ATP synthase subunit I [Thermoplasmata archaeon]|nr:V-type ATP synthase subunit I [Thermoplasmata archaeon]
MPFLRPLPFTKVAIVGLNDDKDTVLSVLHDLGTIQVEPVDKESLAQLGPGRMNERQREVADRLVRFRGLLAALPKSGGAPPSPIAFSGLDQILRATETVPIDDEVGKLKREDDQLITERKGLEQTVALLQQFAHFTGRYDELRARNGVALFGEGDADDVGEWKAQLPAVRNLPIELRPAGDGRVRFLFAVPLADSESVTRLAAVHRIQLYGVPSGVSGTAAEELPRLTARVAAIDRRRGEIAGRLQAISNEWYPRLAALAEALEIENRKFDTYSRLGSSDRGFVLQGWVPNRDIAALRTTILAAVHDRAEIYPIPTHEEPPTYIENPHGIRRFEFLVRFYSLPQATEFDPTWVFAFVFPIFYGLMLADWGYGLVILGICLWMIGGFPGRQHLPNGLKKFLTSIVSPNGMRSLAFALVPGCLIAIGLGLLFNSFFGAQVIPGYNSPVDPLHHVGTYLKVAGLIGIGMVVFGFFLGALKEYFHHRIRHAIAKVGGIVATVGLSVFGYGLLSKTLGGPTTLSFFGPLTLLVAGAILVAYGEGAQNGLMGVMEMLSHVLSYTRLIGILLASIILATVINTVTLGPNGHSGLIVGGAGMIASGSASVALKAVLFVILGLVILVVGQVFNLVLGVFEPGIQGARLIFVEYFSKFYEGNGKEFHPLKTKRVYTAPLYPAPPPAP